MICLGKKYLMARKGGIFPFASWKKDRKSCPLSSLVPNEKLRLLTLSQTSLNLLLINQLFSWVWWAFASFLSVFPVFWVLESLSIHLKNLGALQVAESPLAVCVQWSRHHLGSVKLLCSIILIFCRLVIIFMCATGKRRATFIAELRKDVVNQTLSVEMSTRA